MLVIWLQISFQPFQNLGKLKLKETEEKERELQQMLTFWASIVIISNFLPVITMIRGIMRIKFMITRDKFSGYLGKFSPLLL